MHMAIPKVGVCMWGSGDNSAANTMDECIEFPLEPQSKLNPGLCISGFFGGCLPRGTRCMPGAPLLC